MATVAAPITDADIFSEVIGENPDMPPEVANLVLGFHFSEAQKARMLDLADKGNRGILRAAEQAEMESYRRVGSLLSILTAKARLALKNQGN